MFSIHEERFLNLPSRILKSQELLIHPRAYRFEPIVLDLLSLLFYRIHNDVYTLRFTIPPACQIELSPLPRLEAFPTVVSGLESLLRGVGRQLAPRRATIIKEMTTAYPMMAIMLKRKKEKSIGFIVSPYFELCGDFEPRDTE